MCKHAAKLTFDQARDRLGFMPFDEFARRHRDKRGSGRTTKMLVEAVVASQNETVAIRAYSPRYTDDLVARARQMAVMLNLDPKRIEVATAPRGIAATVFLDHYGGVR